MANEQGSSAPIRDSRNSDSTSQLLLDLFIWGPKDARDTQMLFNGLKYKTCEAVASAQDGKPEQTLQQLQDGQNWVVQNYNAIWGNPLRFDLI